MADEDVQTPTKSRTHFLKIKKLWLSVTLEPMLFLKMVAESNFRVVADTLEIDRVCRINLNFSNDDCMNMDDGNHSDIQEAVQVYQNTFNYNQNLIDSILPVLVILFAGSLSDRYGRKLPLATVLAGFVAFSIVYIVAALNPSWPVEVLYVATVAVDLTGTWVVFNMAVYSYLADIVSIDARTKRMGWLDAVWYLGGPIGTWLGGWLYHSYGYVTVFTVSGVLWLFCFLYVVFVVKETIVPSADVKIPSSGGFCEVIADFRRTAIQSYPHKGRFHLYSLIALKLGVFLAQGHQVYLWARRVLGWDASQFSTWSGADEAVHQVGMVLWVGLASFYHYSDHTVAIVGLISIGLWSVTLACITGPDVWWLTILASLLGSLEASIEPALRSLITCIPISKNVGKILAMLGLMESIWLIVDRTLYTYLYNTFVSTFPQINFVVQSAITTFLILAITLLKRDWLRRRTAGNVAQSNEHSHKN